MIMPVDKTGDEISAAPAPSSVRWGPSDMRRLFQNKGAAWRESNPDAEEKARQPLPLEKIFFERMKGKGERIFIEALHGKQALLCGTFRVPAHLHLNKYVLVRVFRALPDFFGEDISALEEQGREALRLFQAELARQNIVLRDLLIQQGKLPTTSHKTDNDIIEQEVRKVIREMEIYCRTTVFASEMDIPQDALMFNLARGPS